MSAAPIALISPGVLAPFRNREPLLRGIVVSAIVSVAAVAGGLVESRLFGRPIIEPLVLAILIGMAVRTLRPNARASEAGVRFVAKEVLEFAVLLLGATMDVPRLFASGPALALGIAALVTLALTAGVLIGRVVGLSKKLAILVACGNAICGNSAIAAVAPTIDASREDVAASIALTAVLGVGMVLLLPLLMHPLGFSNYQYGVLAGLTVYAVPQVLAAAFAVSPLSGQVATVVKLARVLMLGPVVLFFSVRHGKGGPDGRAKPSLKKLVPWFIAGFVVLATARSLHVVPDIVADWSKSISGWLTIAAMAALGLSVDVRTVGRVGRPVMAAVFGSLATLLVLAVSLIHVLHLR